MVYSKNISEIKRKSICAWMFVILLFISSCGTEGNNGDPLATSSSTWKSVDAGMDFTMAIRTDNTLWAWGNNAYGQLGNGTWGSGTSKRAPIQIGTDTWNSISTGRYHSLGIKSDGTLWAWGLNNKGQLGTGTTLLGTCTDAANTFDCSTVPVQVGTDNNWQSVSTGGYHTLAIKTDGTLWAWGDNFYGELGAGPAITANQQYTPVQIGTATWIAVSVGKGFPQLDSCHSLGIQSDGSLWVWGSNHDGALGDITVYPTQATPYKLGTATWIGISAGKNYSMGIQSDGSLWAWGQNLKGQLGTGILQACWFGNACVESPTRVGTGTWSKVEAGEEHTLGIMTDGTLWAWGLNNFYNQLGATSSDQCFYDDCSVSPIQVGSATNWIGLAASGNHSHGIQSNNTLWSWGSNYDGELGLNTYGNQNTPTIVP